MPVFRLFSGGIGGTCVLFKSRHRQKGETSAQHSTITTTQAARPFPTISILLHIHLNLGQKFPQVSWSVFDLPFHQFFPVPVFPV